MAPSDLGDDVGEEFGGGEALADDEADGDGRVEMAAGDVADGEGHGQDGQAEGECDADEADVQDAGKAAREDCASAATEDKPEGSEELG